jgi:iron complex transport system permease protein
VAAFALRFGVVEGASWELIRELRLPRIILATAVGLGLAITGAALQAVFSNPLCEPYTLGISSGAALGTVLGITLGEQLDFYGFTLSAFVGAFLFVFILDVISKRPSSTTVTVLLTGVMLSFLGSSLVSLWMAMAEPGGMQSAVFWLMGGLSRANSFGSVLVLALTVTVSFLVWIESRGLDALLMGEDQALSVGVDVPRVRRRIIFYTSIIIGICVSSSGQIGFIGLMIPHFVRRFSGSLHQNLIPLCGIWGAIILILGDLGARILGGGYELPVGVLTALIGAPLFIFILSKRGFLQ